MRNQTPRLGQPYRSCIEPVLRWLVSSRGRRIQSLGAITLLTLAMFSAAEAQRPVLVSVKGPGTLSSGGDQAEISADGRFVVFMKGHDVYLRDLQLQTLSKMNGANPTSGSPLGLCSCPYISADGRFVTFQCEVAFAKNDVFVRDVQSGSTSLVSVNMAGTGGGNQTSYDPVISANGRFITFESDASNLVANDNNNSVDIFVRDLQANTTSLVSVNSAGTASGNRPSYRFGRSPQVISADGRFIVFQSGASDLTPISDTNNTYDIFVRDMQAGLTTLVSVNKTGTASVRSGAPTGFISANGQVVVFSSISDDVTANHPLSGMDWYARNLATGTTTLVTVNKNGVMANNWTSETDSLSLSADGRYIAFTSAASDLVDKDTNNGVNESASPRVYDVFVRDLQTATTTLLTLNSAGTDSANNNSFLNGMSDDGRFVTFTSTAGDLVTNPALADISANVYVRDLQARTTTLVNVNYAGKGSGSGGRTRISGNGHFVVFEAGKSLVPNEFDVGGLYAVALNGQFQFSTNGYSVDETDGQAIITVNRLNSSGGGPATLRYSTGDDTARAGVDYVQTSGALSFDAGEMSKSFTIPVLNDALDENDRVIHLFLSDEVGQPAPSTLDMSVLKIVDDDPTPTLSINDVTAPEKLFARSDAIFVVSLSAPSDKTVTVNFATSDGTATHDADYFASNTQITINPGQTTREVFIPVSGDAVDEGDETFFANLSNPVNATIADGQGQCTIINDNTPVVQFAADSYRVAEGAGSVTVTVTRRGDTSAPMSVKYSTSDSTNVNFQCGLAGTTIASRKCDYHIAAGTLRFAAGETTKQFTLSVVDDVYVEGDESFIVRLTNPVGGQAGFIRAVNVYITDDDVAGKPNPIDNTSFFVRQLYVDLLSREPDAAGWQGWTTRIDQCGQPGQAPPPCDRVTVGGDGFLRSGEFFDRQFFVLRLYRTGLGRILRYEDVADLAYVSGFLTAEQLELNKQDLVNEFVTRTEFTSRFTGVPDDKFVDILLQTADVAAAIPAATRQEWITALAGSSKTRAQVLREISERPEVSSKYLHEAQVVSAYYGFFTRNPDGAYLNYLQRLDSGEINLSDLANAFINAQEYRQRFGQ